MRYQLLIPTIPHRHDKLCHLLEVLDAQMVPEVRALIWRDNLQASYREKLQGLMDAATGDYVSVLQDDDSVAPDFLAHVLAALESSPDQVGWLVRYTEGGVLQCPVYHSMQHQGWYGDGAALYRDHMYFNPMRRELAQAIPFRGQFCDEEWAADHRAAKLVNTEVFINQDIFWYQRDSSDNFHTPRQPFAPDTIPPLPVYPWLDVLES
jgi:hypothetical protein